MASKHFRKAGDFMLFRADAAIRCPGCKHVKRMSRLAFAQMFPKNPLLVTTAKRFGCAECGHKGAEFAAVPRLD
jgi:hypothetical protein